ncbi:MAG: cell division protein FtsK, partial [Proteobacteria bacterium]|nr:cell division protein FtsK [Pseudomonadota bacterium]
MIQTKIKNKRKSPPSETPARLTRLARETLVIALVALTGYLLICLVSYSPLDPAWTSTGDDGSTRNLGGRFGAWFADLFLHAFGYAAYLFPVIFGLLSARMLRNRDHPSSSYARFVHGIGIALTVLSACGIEYVHFANRGSDIGFSGGGW